MEPSPTPICPIGQVATDFGCIPEDPIGFTASFYGIGLGIIGGVAMLFIIWGGYLIMTSRGNPVQLQNGRGYILYAVVGLLLAIFGYAFVRLVIVDILHLPGFN